MNMLLLTAAMCFSHALAATAILPVGSSSVNVQQSGQDYAYSIQQHRGAVAVESAQPVLAAHSVGARVSGAAASVPAQSQQQQLISNRGAPVPTYVEAEQQRLREKNEAIKVALRTQAHAGAFGTGEQARQV